ncbi:MAG: hypothetical protein GY724_13475 [Actinomycetia bacterium]|nr:hypothetical protein [Actinomycetes bacterium]MCP4226153.1 hypothetical protein [Actinomycetes bacterium]MCP5034540.1 hypothetical protein [Actinomycetes bacterium]
MRRWISGARSRPTSIAPQRLNGCGAGVDHPHDRRAERIDGCTLAVIDKGLAWPGDVDLAVLET